MMANTLGQYHHSVIGNRITPRSYFLLQTDRDSYANPENPKDSIGKDQKNMNTYEHDTRSANQVVCDVKNEEENEKTKALDAALLLTSLASKTKVRNQLSSNSDLGVSPRFSQSFNVSVYKNEQRSENKNDFGGHTIKTNRRRFSSYFPKVVDEGNSRIRTVSVDHSGHACPPYESLKDYINDRPTMVINKNIQGKIAASAISPPTTPIFSGQVRDNSGSSAHGKSSSQKCKRQRGRPMLDPRKRFCQRKHEQTNNKTCKEQKKCSQNNSGILNSVNHATNSNSAKGFLQSKYASMHPVQKNTTILRRKFSWKNYPELEAFLIANREEYLRHSALNYTTQQKQYNNRLTERLIELASSHGYVFDKEAFSFVTVRDRIRCYYKSYVQSSKKRGLIIGYAARKAGLLTDDDLQRSARVEGRIIVPEV